MSKLDELEKIVVWAKEVRNDARNFIRRRDEVYITEAQSRFEEELTYDTVLKLITLVRAAQGLFTEIANIDGAEFFEVDWKKAREVREALAALED